MKRRTLLVSALAATFGVLTHTAVAQISDATIDIICSVESEMLAASARMWHGVADIDEVMAQHPPPGWPEYTRVVIEKAWSLYDHPNFNDHLAERLTLREARMQCEASLRGTSR